MRPFATSKPGCEWGPPILAMGRLESSVNTIRRKAIESWWSFQPIKAGTQPPVPLAVQHADWPLTNIDRFVAARWEKHGLSAVADADPEVLLRRLRFDLTGLPPNEQESTEFVNRWQSLGSREELLKETVDRLLSSHEYAERW